MLEFRLRIDGKPVQKKEVQSVSEARRLWMLAKGEQEVYASLWRRYTDSVEELLKTWYRMRFEDGVWVTSEELW